MTEAAHSKYSASAAKRWLSCPGSMVLSQGKPDTSSVYAFWGTCAHDIADQCIARGAVAEDYLGATRTEGAHTLTVDQDMVDCVNTYLQHVAELTAGADMVRSETRTNYSKWLGVPTEAAWGTADLTAVWIEQRHLLVGDLKTGMGVEVDAEQNEQGMLYAGGELLEMEDLGIEIDTIDIAISQPRIKSAPSVWRISADDLRTWLTGRARSGASSVQNAEFAFPDASDGALGEWQALFLRPGEDQCRWCKAKATCPALRDEVADTVFYDSAASPDEFEDMVPRTPQERAATFGGDPAAWLSAALSKVDLIEDWCKAVRAEVERRLLAGEAVPNYKLVQGKRGARAWTDEAAAEALLKSFRLKTEDMYSFKVITPTATDKLVEAGTIGPRQAPKLKALIVQRDGKPHVAPLSDKRPALEIKPAADDFETVSADADDLC